LEFSDSTIEAARIATDSYNNIYLLSGFPGFELQKYDSNGVFQWKIDSLPYNSPWGDYGFNLLTDFTNDILVLGLNDSMYKFHDDGNLVWVKPMLGLDNYQFESVITYSNFLAISGSVYDTSGTMNVMVALFDQNGNRSWYGTYDSNNQQEFSVSLAIDYDGIYVLEDSINNTSLIKFINPISLMQVDYSLVCTDSVWYDPTNPILINVRLFNGNINHMNYPSVQIVSSSGDTISNQYNLPSWFIRIPFLWLELPTSAITLSWLVKDLEIRQRLLTGVQLLELMNLKKIELRFFQIPRNQPFNWFWKSLAKIVRPK
jgi:hypothetical protein